MSDTVIVALISGGLPLVGTIITVVITAIGNRKKLGQKIDGVEAKLNAHIKEEEWTNAKQMRIRILRFYDEICQGKLHSENHFEEILDDVDAYESFCKAHADYINNKGEIAMRNIKRTYDKLKKKGAFLKGDIDNE